MSFGFCFIFSPPPRWAPFGGLWRLVLEIGHLNVTHLSEQSHHHEIDQFNSIAHFHMELAGWIVVAAAEIAMSNGHAPLCEFDISIRLDVTRHRLFMCRSVSVIYCRLFCVSNQLKCHQIGTAALYIALMVHHGMLPRAKRIAVVYASVCRFVVRRSALNRFRNFEQFSYMLCSAGRVWVWCSRNGKLIFHWHWSNKQE